MVVGPGGTRQLRVCHRAHRGIREVVLGPGGQGGHRLPDDQVGLLQPAQGCARVVAIGPEQEGKRTGRHLLTEDGGREHRGPISWVEPVEPGRYGGAHRLGRR